MNFLLDTCFLSRGELFGVRKDENHGMKWNALLIASLLFDVLTWCLYQQHRRAEFGLKKNSGVK